MTTSISAPRPVTILNDLLQREVSAVETYERAIRHLAGEHIDDLTVVRDHHATAATVLAKRITALGGEAKVKGGPWGAFIKAIEEGAHLLGHDMVIAALEHEEDQVLASYRKALTRLDPESQTLIKEQLLPEQERTHATMRSVKHERSVKA